MRDQAKITQEIDALVMACETETGKPVTPLVLQVVTYFYRLGIALGDLGYRDAKSGRKPLTFSVFHDLISGALTGKLAVEAVRLYGDLIFENYMIGYNKGVSTG